MPLFVSDGRCAGIMSGVRTWRELPRLEQMRVRVRKRLAEKRRLHAGSLGRIGSMRTTGPGGRHGGDGAREQRRATAAPYSVAGRP